MCAGGSKVGGTAHTSVDCDSVGPHDGSDDRVPSRLVAIAGFEQRLSDIEVRTFGDTVSTRVVPRYPDVSDVVPLLQVGERFDERRPVVGDDFAKGAPSAQYVFEDPISNGLRGLCAERTIFWKMCQGAVALYEVLEAA